VGYDFALGRNRQGDIPTLRHLGEEMGYSVRVISEISQGGAAVSSSQVRSLLREGNVAQAARLLGRHYHLNGEVVHGDARGRQLGIPTANLAPWEGKIVPAKGVYATWAWVQETPSPAAPRHIPPFSVGPQHDAALQGTAPAANGYRRVPAVTNIGLRPTFPGQPDAPRIEAHLLNFNRDLYGQNVTLEFIEYLRPEQRFPSIDALLAQIELDKERAKEVFRYAA
jgi:riboflavin kinase/FMN adenylyltransferase